MFGNNQPDEQYRQYASNNSESVANSPFMIMRIDTNYLLKKIRKDIGGKEIIFIQDNEGNMFEKEKQVGLPLANPQGVMHITNMVEEMVNPHTVQGNLKGEHYWEFIARSREEVTNAIVLNCYEWGIDDQYLSYIIDKVMRLIELFLTRPMENEERKSYQNAIQSREVIATNTRSPGAMASFSQGFK